MKIEAPQGRYKIIEREGRLVTIDTHTGIEVGTGTRYPPPPMASSSTGRTEPSPAPEQQYSEPGANAFRLVQFVFDLTSVEGGSILETKEWFDSDAPRHLFLPAADVRRLEKATLILSGALLLIGLVAGYVFGIFGLAMTFVGGTALIPKLFKDQFAILLPNAEEVEYQ